MSACARVTAESPTATCAARADRVSQAATRALRPALVALFLVTLATSHAEPAAPLSPAAIVATAAGDAIYVGGATSNVLLCLDASGAISRRLELPGSPSGLALSIDEKLLAVTCAAPRSTVCLIDTARGTIAARLPAGHTAFAPVLSHDGRTLFVCNRFNHEVAIFDVVARQQVGRIAVEREPIAAALSADGRHLFVANHLHAGAADADVVAAGVSVIDVAARRVTKTIRLPNGSGLLLGMAVSPEGRYVAITHNIGRFQVPTTQVERGWMHTAALTLIDAASLEPINTVLLDGVERGAANPWAVGWTRDGSRLLVTHAGTHELSVIDFPALREKLARLPATLPPGQTPNSALASNVQADVPNDLSFLVGLRRRVPLQGIAPRALAIVGDRAWVPGYFSDTIDVVDYRSDAARDSRAIRLGPTVAMTTIRRGEMLFNDARLCFQQWQSCASCHSYDARVDALNWDLLNDGIGSPKNAKSLLLAHRTPPAMSTGVRRNAETAVRAGIRHILFASPPSDVADALDDYLSALVPAPSPLLEAGKLAPAAQRGKKLFDDRKIGCAKCHPTNLYTDLQTYDVGTAGPLDGRVRGFDTPTLVELWRTAPYLHDGSAATIRDVLTTHNRADRHGTTSHLSRAQLDELTAYVLSL